jgi:hypothetical protein
MENSDLPSPNIKQERFFTIVRPTNLKQICDNWSVNTEMQRQETASRFALRAGHLKR